ncbi:hypothetical protein PMAYCL1PPCAC_00010, partial [Pristionchus mayeri]
VLEHPLASLLLFAFMSSHLLIVLLIAASVSAQQWSEWTPVNGPCSEDCGMCGTKVVAQRTCISGNCVGESEQTEVCEEKLCLFPKKVCCAGYKKGINLEELKLKCVPI